MLPIAAVYAAATFVSTLLGGLFALRFSGWMDRIMAFSGGVLLGAGLLDLLPEAIALHADATAGRYTAGTAYTPLLWVVSGFVFFYLVERIALLRSYHSHHHHPEHAPASPSRTPGMAGPETEAPDSDAGARDGSKAAAPARRQVGILGAAGLCIHSLLDGFSIGVAFQANHALGVVVALAVIAHDFSDGVSTVTLLLSNLNSRRTSLLWLILDAASPMVGVGLAALLPLPPGNLSLLLGGFAGMFLYLGATHMLPEAHAISDSWITVAWMLAGVGMMIAITRWAGG